MWTYNYTNELQHWGIKGQKWGIRRFQNKDGSLTPAGRKRYADEGSTDPETAKKAHEEARQKAVKSGSATDLLKFKGELTQQEMQYASARLTWEQQMSRISSEEIAAGKKSAKKVFDTISNVTDYVNTTAKAWNTVANIYNAFSKNPVSLPKIDTEITKGNRDKRKQEKAEEEGKKKKAAKQEEQKKEAEKKRAEQQSKQKSESKSKNRVDSDDKVYEGEVFGEGTSKRTSSDKTNTKNKTNMYYTDSYEVYNTPMSSVSTEVTSRGRSFVSGFLGSGEKED